MSKKQTRAVENPKAKILPLNQRPPKSVDCIFQFKITLCGSKPPIWRRVQTKDCSLALLHNIIQAAMGWQNCHLHQFLVDGVTYGPVMRDDFGFASDMQMEDESQVPVSQLLAKRRKGFRLKYEYDFGDSWEHEIVFEGGSPIEPGTKYPLCSGGARACPPEDVGGIPGFYEFLAAMADPENEQQDEFMEWADGFDPNAFDPGEAMKSMRLIR